MQLHIGAELFRNVIVQYSELTSKYHIGAVKDVNRPRQHCDITCMLLNAGQVQIEQLGMAPFLLQETKKN
jgi:hypothetical protein